MAAIFAHLFDNVNLATAWYYNILSHTEVALAPYSPESICIFPVGFGVGELVTHSWRGPPGKVPLHAGLGAAGLGC